MQRRRRSQDQLGGQRVSDPHLFYAGDFSQLDVESIDIDKDMDRMMVTLNDGTIIASENYFVPTEAMNAN